MTNINQNRRDPERNKSLLFLIALIFVLLLLSFVFEYDFSVKQENNQVSYSSFEVDVEILPPLKEFKIENSDSVLNNDKVSDKTDETFTYPIEFSDKNNKDKIQDIPVRTDSLKSEKFADETVYVFTDKSPQFPGGKDELDKYISRNLNYPKEAVENNVQGKVLVGFIISETGKVIKPEILKSVSPALDKEAINLIENMPAWIPGKKYGRNVKVKYLLPVNFVITKN